MPFCEPLLWPEEDNKETALEQTEDKMEREGEATVHDESPTPSPMSLKLEK